MAVCALMRRSMSRRSARQDRAAMRLPGAEQHHLAGLVLGRVQHRREACGPFAHRTAGEHVVAAHAHDQHIRPVIDIADHPVAHTSSGRAELADRTPGHRPTGTLATRAASSGIMPFDWSSTLPNIVRPPRPR